MQLYSTPENPLPERAICVSVRTHDGMELRALRATAENPRGTVILLGGRADYMERYFETIRDLMARGFTVVAFDFRGQGGSQRLLPNPLRGHIRDFKEFDEDLRAVMTEVVLPHCDRPYYAIAHSTGGNILLHNLRKQQWFDKAIILAPLIGLIYGNWPLWLVRILLFLCTSLGFGWMFLPGQSHSPFGRRDFPGNPLSSDKKRWDRDTGILEQFPQLGTGGPTFSWLKAARKSMASLRVMKHRDVLTCPVHIVAAGLDRVVDLEAMHRFANRVSGVSVVVVRESLHEILSERDEIRNQFLAMFEAFIDDRRAP